MRNAEIVSPTSVTEPLSLATSSRAELMSFVALTMFIASGFSVNSLSSRVSQSFNFSSISESLPTKLPIFRASSFHQL